MTEEARPWYVYIVESERGALYTGVTTCIERRLGEHAGSGRGARWFRFSGPARLRYVEAAAGRGDAQRREAAIKRLTRQRKLELIGNGGLPPAR